MRQLRSRRGQGLVEYIMIVVLMTLLCVGAIKKLGQQTESSFDKAAEVLKEETEG
jgi:Flp pilus assembly pilin Flp